MKLPLVQEEPCAECPWRRASLPGWLGPFTAQEWLDAAHGENPIACHLTIVDSNDEGEGDWTHPAMRQCAGAAIYRANVCKLPHDSNIAVGPADREAVFGWRNEFLEHHQR